MPATRKRGTFDAAMREGYVPTPCYLVGPIAVHRGRPGSEDRLWRLSHAATGLGIPYSTRGRLKDACEAAERVAKAIDWTRIIPGAMPLSAQGMTPRKVARIRAVLSLKGHPHDP